MRVIFYHFFIALIFAPSICLKAQTSSGMQLMINPSVVDLKILRGGLKVFPLELTNLNVEKKLRFHIYANDLKMKRDGSVEFLPPKTTKRSCAEWIEIRPKKLTIEPDSSKKVIIKISPPASALPGGYYAAIICELVSEEKEPGSSGVKITWRVASLVKLTVTGGRLEKKAEIVNLRLAFPEEIKTRGVAFIASLKNRGNVHIKAKGKIVVRTLDRRRKGQVDFDVGTGTVLPDSIRDFKAVYTRFLPVGDYVAEAIFRYGGYKVAKREIPFSVTVGKQDEFDKKGKNIVELPPLSVQPSLLELRIPAGGFHTTSITVINQMKDTVLIKTSVDIEKIEKKDKEKLLKSGATSQSCVKWFKLTPSEFTLSSGSKKKIILNIKIPQGEKGKRNVKILFKPVLKNKEGTLAPSEVTIKLTIPVFGREK